MFSHKLLPFMSLAHYKFMTFMTSTVNQDFKKRKLTKAKSNKSKPNNDSTSDVDASPKRVILDCDVGTDDAVALFLLLSAELKKLVKIEMIVCTRGNSSLRNVCRNTIRLLEVAKRTDIPVYKGSHEAFLPTSAPDEFYHGVDGFGDLKHQHEPDLSLIRPEPALIAMRDLIVNNPKEITVIGIGPLTNIALLMRYYGDVNQNIKDLYIMGGNHLGIGNVTHSAEFNFFTDPEAAQVVLYSAECPLNLLTWETCLETKIPLKWRIDALGNDGGETWKLIDRAERVVYKNMDQWLPCDAFLVAAMLYPDIVKNKMRRYLDVELHGKLTRGQMVVDHLNKTPPNATIIQQIDSEMFKHLMCSVFMKF